MTGENNNGLIRHLSFSEAEQRIIICKLWELLKLKADKYNSIDSTSMPVEKAQDILESLLYTIGVAVENGTTKYELLNGNLSYVIDIGQSILKEKKKTVKVEWKLMCQGMPRIKNVYYLSTIKNLGMFFKNYDIYYEAHQIPCSIDYWPLCHVSEKLKGISYIEEYIRCIQTENDFLNCFEENDIICLCKRYVTDYTESLFNLCEPVLTNAIGLCMLSQDIYQLNISSAQRMDIYNMLIGKSADDIKLMVEQAVLALCKEIGMTEKNELDYLICAASGLSARIYEALKHQDLSYIFISFKINSCV